MVKEKKFSRHNFFSTIWKKMKKKPVSTSSSSTSLPMPETSSASLLNKKKKTAFSSSTSTSLPIPEVSSVAPISSRSTRIRFFEQDPPLIPEKDYCCRDLKVDDKIVNTQELAYLLQQPNLSPEIRKYLQKLSSEVIQAFVNNKFKSSAAVAEVVVLVPTLDKEPFEFLLGSLVDAINKATLLKCHLLTGLAQVIGNVTPGHLSVSNLVTILESLKDRLQKTLNQDIEQLYKLTQAVSHVVDAMADSQVQGLNRKQLHTPLYESLRTLQNHKDPYLVYQAAYACQALLYVPDDETPWQSAVRRTSKIVKGVAGIACAVKNVDLNTLLESFEQFSEAFAGIGELIDVAKDSYKNVKSLAESGQQFAESVKEGLDFQQKKAWYKGLRDTDLLLQHQQLADFEQFVRQAPCRWQKEFQWGLCERLAQLASSNPDLNTQKGALSFLEDIYRNDQAVARETLRTLGDTDDAVKQDLYRTCIREEFHDYPLLEAEHEENFPAALLNGVQSKPGKMISNKIDELQIDLKKDMQHFEELYQTSLGMSKPLVTLVAKLKSQQLKNMNTEKVFERYIDPRCKYRQNDEQTFGLLDEVKTFLKDQNKKVLLLIGDAGAGKSTFTRKLTHNLWQDYKTGGTIPLFISLSTIKDPANNLIPEYLKERGGFSEKDIQVLKENQSFTFILDGYDELAERDQNIYMSNHLEEWNSQVIVSCRIEYLDSGYEANFQPNGFDYRPTIEAFQQLVIAPFSADQINTYIEKYVANKKLNGWNVMQYKQIINDIPNLQDLLSNPYILTITVEILPNWANSPEKKASTLRLTRLDLYNQFMIDWFRKAQTRLESQAQLPIDQKEALNKLKKCKGGFRRALLDLVKAVALKFYETQKVVVVYPAEDDDPTWEPFFSEEPKTLLLRGGLPLKCTKHAIGRNDTETHHSFLHKSLMEYFVARAIYEALIKKIKLPPIESVLNAENILHQRNLLKEPGVLSFLVEYVQQGGKLFQEKLRIFIEDSKINDASRVVAANAITVLVKAGIQFSGQDLQGIRIPGADLSYGVFDHVQLQGADLRGVSLQGTWLRGADFRNANLLNVEFGESPALGGDDERNVFACCYSRDGGLLAVAKRTVIVLYKPQNLEKVHTLEGHTDYVRCVSFSPDGSQLASGSDDETVRLWSIKDLKLLHMFQGHTDSVNSVSFSPDGSQLASGSEDKTVRLWSTKEQKLLHTFEGHSNYIRSVLFSPDGSQLAWGSSDKTVRLWSIKEQKLLHTLKGHTGVVRTVSFSPDGSKLASGGEDNTVRLWSIETQQLLHTFQGHTDCVNSISFSPDSPQLVTGSDDETVRLWSIQEQKLLHTLEGHTDGVNSVSFSPDGSQLASGSDDKTVRLWSIKEQKMLHTLEGHVKYVRSVSFSPDGFQLASGSDDKTVRLWSIKEQKLLHTLEGHINCVRCVSFSPDGSQLASGGDDNTIRLWSTKDQKLLGTLTEHTNYVRSISFSSDGSLLASGSWDKTVRLWSTKEQKLLGTLTEHTDKVWCVSFSPDGFLLASGSDDETVRLWSINEQKLLHTLEMDKSGGNRSSFSSEAHKNGVNSISFSPDGSQLASGNDDKIVRLWSITEPILLHRLEGHIDRVLCVSFSPDGSQLASGSEDKTVRIWSVISGKCVTMIQGFHKSVFALTWKNTPFGEFLLTGGADKTVRLWQVENDSNSCRAILRWASAQTILTAFQACLRDVVDLNSMNALLLKQCGAIDEI